MRIAVTHENGEIFQHFGHSRQFKLYEVEGDRIVSSRILNAIGAGHSALSQLLEIYRVKTLICGGIGGGAVSALERIGVDVCAGVSGDCDEAVKAYLTGTLIYTSDPNCSHHDHDHEEGSCSCSHDDGSCSCSHH